ncbi:anion transporter [Oscillatoria sp. FACHB-1406]|nr:anion transporter [Oscillatoria sp. FACHB-1406]
MEWRCDLLNLLRYLLLAIAYFGLALGRIPGFRLNRATIALVAAAGAIALSILSLKEAWDAIDANTIVFLLSMTIVNAHLGYSGFFHFAIAFLVRHAKSPFGLLVILTFGSGILSAFFLNDTIALICTPLILQLTVSLNLNPIPYLLALAAATNIGSVATLSGNPQNILIGSFSQISYIEFSRALTPIALIGLAIQIILLCLLYPEVRSFKSLPPLSSQNHHIYRPLFYKTLTVTILLLIAFILGYPLGESSLVAAAALLVTRRLKPERVLKQVDWNLLVMFSGLFVLAEATQKLNILQIFTPFFSHSSGIFSTVVLLSNLISNVPAVLLLQPLILPKNTQAWLLLAAGSTLAGNLTLFGSVANLIVVEAAAKKGYTLTFFEHLRLGLPLTAITLAIAYFFILHS